MYRDGNFQNLRWNMLEASHKAHWEKLSSVYGLEEPEKLLKSEAQKKDMPVLDQLAELCICSCQNYLFSLTPVKDVSNVFNDVLTAPDDLPMRIRRDMPHHFELALRDHLIVTFAYRFCCDNLEPRSFDDYVNTLFDYIAEFDKTANPIDLAEIRKNYRRDFRKDFRNKYRNFCEQFTLTTSESGGECTFGTAGIKKLDKVISTYKIPDGEQIVAYMKGTIPLFGLTTEGTIITDCALYIHPCHDDWAATNRFLYRSCNSESYDSFVNALPYEEQRKIKVKQEEFSKDLRRDLSDPKGTFDSEYLTSAHQNLSGAKRSAPSEKAIFCYLCIRLDRNVEYRLEKESFSRRACFIWRTCFFRTERSFLLVMVFPLPMILLLLIFLIWFCFPVSLMFMFIFVSRDFLIRRPSAPAHWLPRTAALPTLPTCRT